MHRLYVVKFDWIVHYFYFCLSTWVYDEYASDASCTKGTAFLNSQVNVDVFQFSAEMITSEEPATVSIAYPFAYMKCQPKY